MKKKPTAMAKATGGEFLNTPYCLSDAGDDSYWIMSVISVAIYHGSYTDCVDWSRRNGVPVYDRGIEIVTGARYGEEGTTDR